MSLPTPSSSIAGSSGPKIQIPRLPQKRTEARTLNVPVNRPNRIGRACLTCRSRKVKCNGGVPCCSKCNETATHCVYVCGRKDRLRTATAQNQKMVVLLRELRSQVVGDSQRKIDDLLAVALDDTTETASTIQNSPKRSTILGTEASIEEAGVSVEAGSNGEQGLEDENHIHEEHSRIRVPQAYELSLTR
ncbi:hypothetical protein ACN47E_000369 [Coniothyrium glycines]